MPTPAYKYESPDQLEDYEVMNPDGNVELHFPENPVFLLPEQLPAAILEEFRDKVAPYFSNKTNVVEFPDGSTGQRVIHSGGDQVRITSKNDKVIESATYRYPEGRKLCTETTQLTGQSLL